MLDCVHVSILPIFGQHFKYIAFTYVHSPFHTLDTIIVSFRLALTVVSNAYKTENFKVYNVLHFKNFSTTCLVAHCIHNILHFQKICYLFYFYLLSRGWLYIMQDSLDKSIVRILKAHSHSHSMSGGSFRASLGCHCRF